MLADLGTISAPSSPVEISLNAASPRNATEQLCWAEDLRQLVTYMPSGLKL